MYRLTAVNLLTKRAVNVYKQVCKPSIVIGCWPLKRIFSSGLIFESRPLTTYHFVPLAALAVQTNRLMSAKKSFSRLAEQQQRGFNTEKWKLFEKLSQQTNIELKKNLKGKLFLIM